MVIIAVVLLAFVMAGCSNGNDITDSVSEIFTVESEQHHDIDVDIVSENHNPITITVIVNKNHTVFEAYEISGELFFLLQDLIYAFEGTQAQDFWHDNIFDYTHYINERRYVTLKDIALFADFEIEASPDSDVIIINTNEPHIGEFERQTIEYFLFHNYPQLFTFEAIKSTEEPGVWFHPEISYIFDFNGGIPGVCIKFVDAGSFYTQTNIFIDGEYQNWGMAPRLYRDDQGRIDSWAGFSHDGIKETSLTPARFLFALPGQVTDSINQRLWPSFNTLPNGTIVDTRIDYEIVNLVLRFFEENRDELIDDWFKFFDDKPAGELVINEIKKSQISEELLRATITYNSDYTEHVWLCVGRNDDSWVILTYTWGQWWYGDSKDG